MKHQRRTGYMWEKRIENRNKLVKRIIYSRILRKILRINLIDY